MFTRFKLALTASAAAALCACTGANDAPAANAQAEKPAEKAAATSDALSVKTTDLGSGLYMIKGQGGNVGVAVGPDSVLVIDDQFARMSTAILSAISDITDKPVAYMINTHYHGDHTGGNENFAAAGATIIAHDNVHKRMSETQKSDLFDRKTPPSAVSARPHITFSDTTTFQTAGQKAKIHHVPGAHTDGDSIIHFEDANVIHMGDNFFHNMFPYIDTAAGGSIKGMIAAHQKALDLSNEATQIIPGHGPMADKADLQAAQNLLKKIRARVQARINAGNTLEEAIAADPLKGMESYAAFIDKDNMVKAAYMSLTQ